MGVYAPSVLYVSKAQDKNLLYDFSDHVITDSSVGRFDLLLKKKNEIILDANNQLIQILCSGAPYDIIRSIEFAKRIKKNRNKITVVFHPSTSMNLLSIGKFICKLHLIQTQVGFKGNVSPNLPTFTCGTSLLNSIKSVGVRVKDIGGKSSQF